MPLLKILCFFSLLFTPTLKEGRVIPLTTFEQQAIYLPLINGEWECLEKVVQATSNPTIYSDDQFKKISIAYQRSDQELLRQTLFECYQSIGGKIMRQGSKTALYYPTITKLKAEVFYQKIPLALLAFLGYLGAILTFRWKKISWILIIGAFLAHSTLIALRCVILGRPPVSNMVETILFIPWVILPIAIALKKRILLSLSCLINALFLFVVIIKGMDQTLTTVQPVLNSKFWLLIHVLMVVSSFAIFFLAGFLAHVVFFRKKFKFESTLLQLIYLGTALLIPGTILGGIWAAQSWGRFWDWDPKEAWAFISAGIYLLAIHSYRLKKISLFGLAALSIIGMCSISFTWYGVNYVLGTGLHSYGFGTSNNLWYFLYLGVEIIFLIFIFTKKLQQISK